LDLETTSLPYNQLGDWDPKPGELGCIGKLLGKTSGSHLRQKEQESMELFHGISAVRTGSPR